jgi:spore germination protein
MQNFEYGDKEIGKREIVFAVTSMIIGVGILTLPRMVSKATNGSDGWISITIAGGIAIFFAWIVAKLAARFPKQSFFEYTSSIVTKPVSYILTFLFGIQFVVFTAFESRAIADVSKQYLFDRTPVEVVTFVFLLVVIYAVSGSRTALLRINLMFLPIVLTLACAIQFMNIGFFEIGNLKPFFQTQWTGVFKGVQESIFSFLGFEIMLFYVALMNRPKDAPKAAVIGVSIPLLLYLLLHITVIGVFSHRVTANVIYPTIEIAKEVEIPGGFFERFESVFFTIWIMTIFNTTAMAYDVAVMALSSIFRKVKKITWIFILAPLIYIIAMTPQNYVQQSMFGQFISYSGLVFAILIPTGLLLIAKMRGVQGNG